MRELKATDKITQKMTRDGAVSENLATGEVEHISSREPETELSASSEESAGAAADLALRAAEHHEKKSARKAEKADTQAVRMVLPQGSARPPACNLPRKNMPIPHLGSTLTVPTVRQTGWTQQRPPSPQRKFFVPSVFLTRQPEKARRSFTLKKWRNAPTDACGTIQFPDRSMRSSTPPMRRCMRWNRKMWVLRLDTRARC